ncbi:hypothetical protein B0H16DRAFT_1316633 [Mycena metata]|uniref:Uncharacterized protein n=1 Tax=Mycena metata TaxID=1033252 RepID=A0AAD7NCJ2_9AGAR|nr:hypothetical protein B0H16DRAFT_1316633 [Mycena metata]
MALAAASRTRLNALLETADHQKLIIPAFKISILRHTDFCDHPAVDDLVKHSDAILDAFLEHPRTSHSTLAWANGKIKSQYAQSIRDLAEKDNGWHFSAGNTSAAQLQNFRIEDMAKNMKSLAPELWDLLGLFTVFKPDRLERSDYFLQTVRPWKSMRTTQWKQIYQKMIRHDALRSLRSGPFLNLQSCQKKVVMISVLMQSTNKNCNALESVFGIFLHASNYRGNTTSNTPSKVIEALAHMGISISTDAIDNTVHSLSRETRKTLRNMGQTPLVGYAYDNFNINFPGIVPIVEKSTDTLTHMTSGGLIFLEHGVKADDLRCSEELWKKTPLNPAFDAATAPPTPTIIGLERHLEELHPETAHPSNLTSRERFNSWLFRSDLVKYGPAYFGAEFGGLLGLPEMVEQIPVKKMRWGPAQSLDIKQSTTAGNIQVVPELLE